MAGAFRHERNTQLDCTILMLLRLRLRLHLRVVALARMGAGRLRVGAQLAHLPPQVQGAHPTARIAQRVRSRLEARGVRSRLPALQQQLEVDLDLTQEVVVAICVLAEDLNTQSRLRRVLRRVHV